MTASHLPKPLAPAQQPPAPGVRRAPRPEGKPMQRAPSAAQGAAGVQAAGLERINKRMAALGLCSRREADAWVEQGWVTVNGEVAQMGQQVSAQDRIEVHKAATDAQSERVTILLNKPIGYVSGQPEDGHEPAIFLIRAQTRWAGDKTKQHFHGGQLKNLAPAGRLDIDSTGLLVLTQDGRIARQLIGEDSALEKEYLVRVEYRPHATPEPAAQGAQHMLQDFDAHSAVRQNVQALFPPERLAHLRHGLSLDGKALKPARVDWQNPEQLRFVLTEGKKRQIRRMCELVGLKVIGLKRIRMGKVVLGPLPVGQWRYLDRHENF